MTIHRALLVTIALVFSFQIFAQSNFWQDTNFNANRTINPSSFRALELDLEEMKDALLQSPSESKTSARNSQNNILLPMPNGEMEAFSVVSYQIMHPKLAKKYPELKFEFHPHNRLIENRRPGKTGRISLLSESRLYAHIHA